MNEDAAAELCIWIGLCVMAMFAIGWVCWGIPYLWNLIWTA